MPGLDNWMDNPLNFIHSSFGTTPFEDIKRVHAHYEKLCADEAKTKWLPSVLERPAHLWKNGSLVRARVMIQDMFDPEFYVARYTVKNRVTGAHRQVSGLFCDVTSCGEDEDVDTEAASVTLDRQTFYCVPVPAENDWVKTGYSEQYQEEPAASTSCAHARTKRPNDDLESSQEMEVDECGQGDGASNGSKRVCRSNGATTSSSGPDLDLNFPLKDEKGPACLVKVYADNDKFRLNEVYEFIGVLSVDPALAAIDSTEGSSDELFAEVSDELKAHSPPPSLVPRIHVVHRRKLAHSNPNLPAEILDTHPAVQRVRQNLTDARQLLLTVLTRTLLEDQVAAEYLLCHLLAHVYGRLDVSALGKFSLNLYNVPQGLPALLYKVINKVVCKSHYLPLTVSDLNSARLVPCKDYTQNRLKAGVLQLSDNTQLLVDETVMAAGQLEAQGVANITALGHMVQWQRVEYDFSFHKQPFDTDINTLILSEGKSLVTCDCVLPLVTRSSYDPEKAASAIDELLSVENTTLIRNYITLCQLGSYSITEPLREMIQSEFVENRKLHPDEYKGEDLHSLLQLARLVSQSLGATELTQDTWRRVKTLDNLRKQRLSQLARPNGPAQSA